MTLELRNPLPIGRYWVDVPEKDYESFRAWLSERPSQVHVEVTQEHPGQGWLTDWGQSSPGRTWYLFQVKSPVPWFGPGTPTIAGVSVRSESDTAQRPDYPQDLSSILLETMGPKSVFSGFVVLAGGVAIGLLSYLSLQKAGPLIERVRRRRGKQ